MQLVNLDPLATTANEEHRAAINAASTALVHAVKAGEALAQAKASIGHGGWAEWLSANFEASPRTARGYMALYERRDRLAENGNGVANLSLRDALSLIADKRPARVSTANPKSSAIIVDAVEVPTIDHHEAESNEVDLPALKSAWNKASKETKSAFVSWAKEYKPRSAMKGIDGVRWWIYDRPKKTRRKDIASVIHYCRTTLRFKDKLTPDQERRLMELEKEIGGEQ